MWIFNNNYHYRDPYSLFCNPIKNIKLSPNLTYLDISETNIDNIDYISTDKLIHLVANSCINLKILPRLKELKILENWTKENRLIVIAGLVGIGKAYLSLKLIEKVQFKTRA